ncbi:MAG: hypothetical protein GTO60_02120, partial [Gammaproteobacteria bacterium]|nr:hypothetical protein [Gammaproteobacteria bacterium]NIO61329.1 hypothetical protein [Gammaproteobacteria bacterium]
HTASGKISHIAADIAILDVYPSQPAKQAGTAAIENIFIGVVDVENCPVIGNLSAYYID